jgi:hypothetical protein
MKESGGEKQALSKRDGGPLAIKGAPWHAFYYIPVSPHRGPHYFLALKNISIKIIVFPIKKGPGKKQAFYKGEERRRNMTGEKTCLFFPLLFLRLGAPFSEVNSFFYSSSLSLAFEFSHENKNSNNRMVSDF